MESQSKCACPTCHCKVEKGKEVERNGRIYCSATCANECTQTTCLCVHESCDDHGDHSPKS